jgi:hypothetical protein
MISIHGGLTDGIELSDVHPEFDSFGVKGLLQPRDNVGRGSLWVETDWPASPRFRRSVAIALPFHHLCQVRVRSGAMFSGPCIRAVIRDCSTARVGFSLTFCVSLSTDPTNSTTLSVSRSWRLPRIMPCLLTASGPPTTADCDRGTTLGLVGARPRVATRGSSATGWMRVAVGIYTHGI